MHKLLLAGLAGVMMAGPALADDRGDDRREFREDRQEFRDDRRDFRGDRREFRDDRRDFQDDRPDFRRDARDYRGYQGDHSRNWVQRDYRWSEARYRGPAYPYPRGYGYRPWNVGYRLPPAYYSNRYYIGNPGYYRLPPPYRGTRWVRVGSDALLISIANGIIVQAVRGLYW